MLLRIFLCVQMVPNQSRPRAINAAYATNATGQITGLGRCVFALGQGVTPVLVGGLYAWHPSSCYAYWCFVQVVQLLVNVVSPQPLFHDPPLGRDKEAATPPPARPHRRASAFLWRTL